MTDEEQQSLLAYISELEAKNVENEHQRSYLTARVDVLEGRMPAERKSSLAVPEGPEWYDKWGNRRPANNAGQPFQTHAETYEMMAEQARISSANIKQRMGHKAFGGRAATSEPESAKARPEAPEAAEATLPKAKGGLRGKIAGRAK